MISLPLRVRPRSEMTALNTENSELTIQDALSLLNQLNLSYMLVVEDTDGVAIFSNHPGDRLYIVGDE
jgi:hypothetical protein